MGRVYALGVQGWLESTKDSQFVKGSIMDTGGLGISSHKGYNQEVLGEIDLD